MVKKTELNDTTRAILYDGANLSELTSLFGMDHRVLVEKLHKGGCKPCGKRNGADIYSVRDVAPYIVRPAYDIEQYIKRMHHNDLPKHLTKEFWAGLKSRQDYEHREGNLWETARVISVIGGLLKLVKMSVRLMGDAVDRQAELTPRQRQIIKSQCDGMLEELYRTVMETFKKQPTNEAVIERANQTVVEVKEEEEDEL